MAHRAFPINFNPRPPCGGRRLLVAADIRAGGISIHGPRVGADVVRQSVDARQLVFQSTAPVWGPTVSTTAIIAHRGYFNPRPPCGGRLNITCPAAQPIRFQSTAPVWGPTTHFSRYLQGQKISIHGPRVGADNSFANFSAVKLNFNPRPPCGGRRTSLTQTGSKTVISIHGPRVGADETAVTRLEF